MTALPEVRVTPRIQSRRPGEDSLMKCHAVGVPLPKVSCRHLFKQQHTRGEERRAPLQVEAKAKVMTSRTARYRRERPASSGWVGWSGVGWVPLRSTRINKSCSIHPAVPTQKKKTGKRIFLPSSPFVYLRTPKIGFIDPFGRTIPWLGSAWLRTRH